MGVQMSLGDTICPSCGKRCHLMAGINVLPQFKQHKFLVCWKCRTVKHTHPASKWTPIKDAKQMEAPR